MSVINKMLRDLDARRAYAPGLPRDFAVHLAAERHGRALPLPQLQRSHKAYWTAAVALVLVAAGMGYFASNFYVLQQKNQPALRSVVVITSDPNLELPKQAPVAVAAPTVTAPTPAVPAVAVPVAAPAPVPQTTPAQAVVAQAPFPGPGIPAQKVESVKSPVTVLSPPNAPPQAVAAKAPVPAPTASVQKPEPAKAVVVAPATMNPSPAAPVHQVMPAQTLVAKPPVPVQAVPAQKNEPVKTEPAKPAAISAPAVTVPARAPVVPAAVVAQPAAATAKPVAPTPVPAQTSTPAPQTVANSPAKVQPPPAAASQPNRQAAAQETLAQAQSLWNTGSRDAATDLMREAVAMTERAYNVGALPADSPVLASLVRELARMELAEGRSLRVLELLTRLEPALPGQADLWAVRGNAAQRLSRHEESVKAYSRALAIRPDEPRWMLASAVSLAALGRFDESAELADKAHAAGVVSPDILSYLKQIGVPIKP